MPQDIEVSPGVFVTHALFPKRLVENPDGTNAVSASIEITLDGAVVVPRSVDPPYAEIVPFETDARAVAQPVYLPDPSGTSSLVAKYDAGAGAMDVESVDIAGYARAAADAALSADTSSQLAASASSAATAASQAAAATLESAQTALSDATAGAVRTISGGRDPIYSMFEDETVPTTLADGTLLIVKYRTAP